MFERGNPYRYVDETGHFVCGGLCIVAIGAVAAGAVSAAWQYHTTGEIDPIRTGISAFFGGMIAAATIPLAIGATAAQLLGGGVATSIFAETAFNVGGSLATEIALDADKLEDEDDTIFEDTLKLRGDQNQLVNQEANTIQSASKQTTEVKSTNTGGGSISSSVIRRGTGTSRRVSYGGSTFQVSSGFYSKMRSAGLI